MGKFISSLGLLLLLLPSNSQAAKDLSLSFTRTGSIANQPAQTCTDLVRGGGPAAASPSLTFEALKLVWAPKDRDLFVRNLTLTLTSAKLSGGTQVFSLSTEEIANLLGTRWGIISADPVNGNREIISNQPLNRGASPLCALSVGPLAFDQSGPNPTTVKVTLELEGTAVDSDNGGNQKIIRETFKTTASF